MSSATRRSRSAKLFPLLLIFVLTFVFAGCTQPAAAPTAAPKAAAPTAAPQAAAPTAAPAAAKPAAPSKAFKLGVDGPFSGPGAKNGEEFKRSFQMAMEAINYTIGDYKIQPVWIDDQSDPAKGASAYEQAIVQDKIQAGILNWNSSVAVALMELTAKYKIPHFFGFGATEVVNETFASNPTKYGYWMLKGWPAPAKLAVAYVAALEDGIAKGTYKPATKTVALAGEDTDWGRSFCKAIKGQFEAKGWKIVAEEYFPIDQSEFTPLMTKLKESNPAVLVLSSVVTPVSSAAIKQADQVGLKSLIIADGLGWAGNWYDLTGKASNYVLDQIPQLATEKGKAFSKAYEAKFGDKPSPSAAGLAYDGTNFFIAVANEVVKANNGELTGDGIYKFVKEKVWTGQWTYKDGIVMPEYKYTADTIPDPVVGPGAYMFPVLQYFDGQSIIVYPNDIAAQPLKAKP
ncbi:MAG: ABC transporter substrate-binding protein [Chloroflexi bacterium]|nr:ABC transporter substrate-binding protein [Chloroflexota bacterium]